MKRLILLTAVLSAFSICAKENGPGEDAKRQVPRGLSGGRVMATCSGPTASSELKFNNVRTIIYSGGDMWWDLKGNSLAYYYVPKVENRNTGVSSLFAGSIWLGGLDAGGQLKVAAMTYRQHGIDFWPGPLDTTNASADPIVCGKYDQLYVANRTDVEKFVETGALTPEIQNWPGNGDISMHQGRRLAPFFDKDNDGFYDPTSGDYPAYDVENKAEKDQLGFCKTKLYGDYTLFWVFNDNGGIHTETQGVPIGVEVRAQAFAFKTNDDINNMTFYSYEIFNRSSFQLNQTYFTIWNDADLGYYLDDYVGCDVKRGLGYIYNADPYDESVSGTNGYLDYPPSVGCDFFRGPLADLDPITGRGDGIDNDNDSIVDELGETIQMSRFTYYNNNIGAFPPQTTNPDIAIHFYNYMIGKWKDGSLFTVGGNAYGGTQPAQFVYDGNPVSGLGWTERTAGNLPGDRRFLQTAGPFTLKAGAVNNITFGMPWAQSPNKGGNLQSVELLFNADDKAQALFDNCFKLLDGPEAPVMTIQELPNELVFFLTNEKGKNNYRRFNNDYMEADISITSDPTSVNPALRNPDRFYKFEGYKVYQVKNDAVTSTDLDDPTKAKLVFQCDIANGKGRLVNYELDNLVGGFVPKVKVEGADKGIQTTFKITEDAFSTSDNRKLVNNKEYFFFCVAYAYNEFLPYIADKPVSASMDGNLLGQKRPYLEGRKFKRAAGTPHPIQFEKGGTITQSIYGFGPKITRVEGQGNGGNRLTLTQASEDAIVQNHFVENVTYENAQGPLNIKVIDPLNVKDSEFRFKFINQAVASPVPTMTNNALKAVVNATSQAVTYSTTLGAINTDNTSWELTDLKSGRKYYPNEISGPADNLYQPIKVGGEFYFQDLGFSVNVAQVGDPGEKINEFTDFATITAEANYQGPQPGAFIGANMVYMNGAENWLNSLEDADGQTPANWILSGGNKTEGYEDAHYRKIASSGEPPKVQAFYDPNKVFGKILNGTWAPYPLCASYYSLTAGPRGTPARIFCGPGFSGDAWTNDEFYAKKYLTAPKTSSSPDQNNTDLRKTGSVLVVLTRDKSKWTRSVVLEMQEKSQFSEGNALYFEPRHHASVNKDGVSATDTVASEDPNSASFISGTGMGWFPGYAISLETGERLNIAFGEDSYQRENNGNDMIWNPTSSMNAPFSYAMGGKHFIYVFGTSTSGTFAGGFKWETNIVGTEYGYGRYDHGRKIIHTLKNFFTHRVLSAPNELNSSGIAPLSAVERDIQWVSVPMTMPGSEFKDPANMPSDVKIQINVAKPYRYGYAGIGVNTSTLAATINKLFAVNNETQFTKFTRNTPSDLENHNYNFPMYTFNTNDIATLYNNADVAKASLEYIRVVPNPYYGSSEYEARRTDNLIRITNLPNKCTVKIYSMAGTLVRTIKRDVTGQEDLFDNSGSDIRRSKFSNFVEWDLKNQNNIAVASGLYIIHIDAPGIGEKVLKWFGIMRPLDVQSY